MNENRKLAKAVAARLKKAGGYKYSSGNEGRPAGFKTHPGYVWRRLKEQDDKTT